MTYLHALLLLLHLLLVTWTTDRFGKGKSDKEVLDHLLTNTRYDKRLLPPVDGKYVIKQGSSDSVYVHQFVVVT